MYLECRYATTSLHQLAEISGAHASSVLYSIVETAKANNLVPFDYLHHILSVLSERDDDDTLTALLPWNVSLEVR